MLSEFELPVIHPILGESFCPSLFCNHSPLSGRAGFGHHLVAVEGKVDEHGAAADLAVVVPFGRDLAGSGARQGKAFEAAGAGDGAVGFGDHGGGEGVGDRFGDERCGV